MSLRPFLSHLERHPDAATLAEPDARAFVSQSLRPYLIAAVADRDARRPTVVVAGDDRQSRELAQDLRAWLRPRAVRFYPSRCVAYESHLTPPAHLVGLRVAALDAVLEQQGGEEAPVIVVSAVALSEKVPDPALRPHGFTLRVGELLDLDETAGALVAAGYERVDQVEDRGQFAVRGGLLDVYPATEERAVRVDLFDDEIESLRWFSTFTQRSLGDAEVVEIAPAAELAPEHRELAESAALENPDERPDIAELLSSISGSQPVEIRAQAAEFASRSLREAEPELEKLVRSGYTTVVTWPQRGGAERAAYNLGRAKASFEEGTELVFVESTLRDGFVAPQLKLAVVPEHRLIHRRKRAGAPEGGPRRGRGLLRSFTDLRTGDIVVPEDHGIARFAGFDTKTVAGVTRDYLNL